MKTFEVCDLPVRVAKFVARKHWVVVGAVSHPYLSRSVLVVECNDTCIRIEPNRYGRPGLVHGFTQRILGIQLNKTGVQIN